MPSVVFASPRGAYFEEIDADADSDLIPLVQRLVNQNVTRV
ncbi:hypothetical protein [Neorhizobium galegae]|nr:hypothetical protein [Neorhizobium galegae]